MRGLALLCSLDLLDMGLRHLILVDLTFASLGWVRFLNGLLILSIILLELFMEPSVSLILVRFYVLILYKFFIFYDVVDLNSLELWRQNRCVSHFLELLLKHVLLGT